MSKKLTNDEKLYARKIKKPNFIYPVLATIWKLFVAPKYNVEYKINCDIKKDKGSYFLISNHASRADYIFTGIPALPKRLNYVAGYNEFCRSHLALVFKLLQVIPKKNFTPDSYTIKEITRIIRSGGSICIFPEGMNSISGANQPIAVGTGKLIKHFKIPVYYSVIKGGYLTSPKYNLKDRVGKMEVVIDKLFTKDDLETLTPLEIEDKINKAIYHDDYSWNLVEKNHYNIGDNGAEGLETLLFYCPKCKKQHVMKTKGNTIYCAACNNGASIDDTYALTPFDETCVIPKTQTEWFNLQREVIKEEVKDENFVLEAQVELGNLPKFGPLKDQKTSNIVGEGKLTLNRKGLTYKGTRNGEEFEFFIPSVNLPTYGMCTDVTRFYTFFNGEFMEFYPKENVVEKFFLATEEIHRLNGGKWQDFKFDK